jgi:hypothetical protein
MKVFVISSLILVALAGCAVSPTLSPAGRRAIESARNKP